MSKTEQPHGVRKLTETLQRYEPISSAYSSSVQYSSHNCAKSFKKRVQDFPLEASKYLEYKK